MSPQETTRMYLPTFTRMVRGISARIGAFEQAARSAATTPYDTLHVGVGALVSIK